jgi:hypothetical protein
MKTQVLLMEFLISAFFALACFRSRCETPSAKGLAPKRLFVLVSRLERLQRARWQWSAIVLLLVLARLQLGVPLVMELTALVEFIVFLALPTGKPEKKIRGVQGRMPLCSRFPE